MPWQTINPMDQKIHFISDYLRQQSTFTTLCERYGISRKTGYKLIQRYRQDGLDGLQERSRRPRSHPAQTPYVIRQAIIEYRQRGTITLGAKKIRAKLIHRFPDQTPPSITTINNILAQEGLVRTRRRRRRASPSRSPLARSAAPNDLWTTDFKGQFKLGNGQWCYPLTLMDQYSRCVLGCQAQTSVTGQETRHSFEHLFQEYGLPKRIRSDNGVPFASTATAGLSPLSAWWIRLGIVPERITPGKPQQNGHHERMHRTLKKYATYPPSHSTQTQQQRFDAFRQEFNHERPHESLGQRYPSQVYQPSIRTYPDQLPDVEYPGYFEVRSVRQSGVVYWRNGQVYVSHVLHRQRVGLVEVADGIFDVYFSFYRLGAFDIRRKHPGKTAYWSLKV